MLSPATWMRLVVAALACLVFAVAAAQSPTQPPLLVHHVSAAQRQQLLNLRAIVEDALMKATRKAYHGAGSAAGIDARLADRERAYNGSSRATAAQLSWWRSRPFFIASIAVASLFVVSVLLLFLFCTPLRGHICACCCPDRDMLGSSEKTAYQELTSEGSPGGKDLRALDNCPPYGTIDYAMKFDSESEQLLVTVRKCHDLPKNISGSLDPYVTVRLLNKQHQKLPTDLRTEADDCVTSPVAKKSVSPEFDFTAALTAPTVDLAKVAVVLEIFDWSSSNKHPMVARHTHDLLEAAAGRNIEESLRVQCEFQRPLSMGLRLPDTGPGDICLLLQQGLSDEPFKVKVIECKGVYLRDSDGKVDCSTLPNTYVDITLTEPHGRIHASRSSTVRKSRNPYFNEDFSFPVAAEKLRRCSLRVTLVHVSDILCIKKVIGSVLLSEEAYDDAKLAREHWLAVTQPPGGGIKSRQPQEQQTRVAKSSWHYLIMPDEERRLWRARSATKPRASTTGKRVTLVDNRRPKEPTEDDGEERKRKD